MEFSKPSFKLLWVSLLCMAVAPIGRAGDVQDCMQDGKILFNNQQLERARQKFVQCTQQDPSNPDTYLSLAGVLLRQNNAADAEKQFLKALTKMKEDSPYFSYVYSMLGDLALKQQKNAQALGWYDKSLSVSEGNVNSLIGKGIVTESAGQYKDAAAAYEKALSFEPANAVAHKRLLQLEPFYFSDEQLLNALLQRHALPATEKIQITDKERALFRHIHLAEQRRGVDYLRNKLQKLPPEYVVTLYKDTPFERNILTLEGYNILQKYLGQDAVAAFEQAQIPAKDIFSLRDLKGANVFDQNGYLTDEGYYVYLNAVKGKKTYLLPYEDVAPTEKELQRAQRAIEQLKQQGYVEITRSEYNKVQEVTLCSEETLKEKMDVRTVSVTKHRARYMVLSKEPSARQAIKTVPYYFVMLERSKKNPSVKVPRNSFIEYSKIMGISSICLDDGNLLSEE